MAKMARVGLGGLGSLGIVTEPASGGEFTPIEYTPIEAPFSRDAITYKIKHEYGGAMNDEPLKPTSPKAKPRDWRYFNTQATHYWLGRFIFMSIPAAFLVHYSREWLGSIKNLTLQAFDPYHGAYLALFLSCLGSLLMGSLLTTYAHGVMYRRKNPKAPLKNVFGQGVSQGVSQTYNVNTRGGFAKITRQTIIDERSKAQKYIDKLKAKFSRKPQKRVDLAKALGTATNKSLMQSYVEDPKDWTGDIATSKTKTKTGTRAKKAGK